MLVLGLETSCDETSCGIVDERLGVKANQLFSQIDTHALYGGVVPEIAARAHLEKVAPVVRSALEEAGASFEAIDLIAFTRGPGLLGPLLVGASFAQALGAALGKRVVGVNHLEGHVVTAMMADPTLEPPFVCLVVSGGHTELCRVEADLRIHTLGRTRDDAAGEAFDKCGKLLGLGYPAGARISALAREGRRDFVTWPRALDRRGNLEFSFSGLKTAVLRYLESVSAGGMAPLLPHLCASLEEAIVEILVKKAVAAVRLSGLGALAVVGGVSANGRLRSCMGDAAKRHGFKAVFPPPSLCGDNGAMIAAIAALRQSRGLLPSESDLDALRVVPALPLGL